MLKITLIMSLTFLVFFKVFNWKLNYKQFDYDYDYDYDYD